MRRILLALATSALMTVAAAGTALAVAPTIGHNCTGSFSSAATPAFTSSPAFAPVVVDQAQSGTRDDFSRGITDALSNCGANPWVR